MSEAPENLDHPQAIENRPKKPWLIALILLGGLLLAGALTVTVVVLMVMPTLPSLENMTEGQLKVPLRVYTADGVLIGEFGEERRIPLEIEDTPETLIQAILAAEDDGFYQHYGVSPVAILRAAWANFRSGVHSQGGSTITMQVARNFFLSPEKTYTRKLKEALLSFKLERELGKAQILELYLNKIFLGHRAYGFAAAARIYYGKPLKELTLPEMAMLAGLPKAPSRNNPITNKEIALERRNYVLQRMHTLGFIDEAIYREALQAPLSARKHKLEYDVEAPYISEMVRRYMIDTYKDETYAGGFHVYTTIRSDLQRAANAALRQGLLAYDRRHGYRGTAGYIPVESDVDKAVLDEALGGYRAIGNLLPAVVLIVEEKSISAYTQDGDVAQISWENLNWARRHISQDALGPALKSASDILRVGDIIYVENAGDGIWRLAQNPEAAGALVALRPNDGAILALTGGFDFYGSKFNRVTQAERQPGSNIKPFIYSAALEKGFTAATPVSGAPITIEDTNLEDVWRPENYSGKFFGPTRLRKALTLSLNLVSIRLLRAIGAGYAVDYLQRFGFQKEKLPRNLSLALGTASITPLALARGFNVFASGGFLVEPYFITRIEDGEHNILEQTNPLIVCQQCPESRQVKIQDAAGAGDTEEAAAGETAQKEMAAIQAATAEADKKEAKTAGKKGAEEKLEAAAPGPRLAPRTLTKENAFVMNSIMHDVITQGTGRRALVLDRQDLAGKTGTTNDYRDAWFSGFNLSIVATAWVGFDEPTSLGRGEAGAKAALPIWIEFMKTALQDTPEQHWAQPKKVVQRWINRETGQLTDDDESPDAMEEYFILGENETDPQIIPVDRETATESGEAITPAAVPESLPEGLF